MPALIRVGHRGAPVEAPDNTLAGFEAARAIGVDMIEFDVLPARGGARQLRVAHDYGALDPATSLTLVEALTHFATPSFAQIRLQLDIKRPGCERAVVDALDATGTRSRAFVSTGIRGVLPRFRALAPDVARGWTVPDIPGVSDVPLLARAYRARLPARAEQRLGSGAINALVAHWSLVTPALVSAVAGAGGELYVWTVNDAALIARLAELGVTGVITNDPRLFAAIEQTDAL
jgi:glycerophosphoryl diester phosphodiesterase